MTVDAGARLRPRPDLVSVRLGGELLLFEPDARRLHALNASAALVWQRIDGASTVGDIAAGLGERYAPDRALVEQDVAAVLDRLVGLGLLCAEAAGPVEIEHTATCRPAPAKRRPDPRRQDTTWAWTSEAYRAVDVTFRVHADEATVGAEVARVFRSLRGGDGVARHTYAVARSGAASWEVAFDGVIVGTVTAPDAAVALLQWHLSDVVVRDRADTLFVRAGAVQVADRVVLLPATGDEGATTLTTALVRRGLAYVADDLTAIDVAGRHARAFPRAIGLAARSQALFPDLRPPGLPDGAAGSTRWYVDPSTVPGAVIGRGGPVALVVAAQYLPGSPTQVEQVTGAEAVRVLLDQTLPFAECGAAGFEALVTLAARAPVYRLQFGEIDTGCEVVLELARESC